MKELNDTRQDIWDLIIIGAGASGMMAAITASKFKKRVLLLEHMQSAGKKLLVTGNGKCNYTNLNQDFSYYRGENPDFVASVLSQCPVQKSMELLQEIGIYPKEKNGYIYPYSEQAASVLEAFLIELNQNKVAQIYNCAIRSIQKEKNTICIETKSGNFYGKKCILATGGKAAKKTGSDGSGYLYATRLGHTIVEPVPSLVQLVAEDSYFKEIAGIRIQAAITLSIQNQTYTDIGEVQLTDYGVSGIPVFQVSRFAAKILQKESTVPASLDFLPKFCKEDVVNMLEKRFQLKNRSILETGIGLFPKKLYPILLQKASMKPNQKANQVNLRDIYHLADCIKNFTFTITDTKSFDFAQVTAGGIHTSEIDPTTLESKIVKGLYFAGEIIDIDGACGGYNLQWAWSSGYVSALSAIESLEMKRV